VEILRSISLYTELKEMPFLLIGGHAINAYGLSRQTGDIDLLVQRTKRDAWATLMEKLRYVPFQSDERFARFTHPDLGNWPIDFMFVEDQTFDRLYKESQSFDVGAANVQVVSPKHLAALKMHALKTFQEHRFAKDYTDLLFLLRSGRTELSELELKELCLKYASETLFDRLLKDDPFHAPQGE